jgi:2-aminobenzoate-CoA ligase
MPSAHLDTFVRDNLPAPELQPTFLFDLPELKFPAQLNCAGSLLDQHIAQGNGARACLRGPRDQWTYQDLRERANRIANVLVNEMGLVPGNRVLLHAPNTPMMVACWFGIVKAGGVAVATMPLLRASELKPILEIAQISHVLCDAGLAEAFHGAAPTAPALRQHRFFNGDREERVGSSTDSLEVCMQRQSAEFQNVDTAADDACLIGFTSGTTGVPKATIHFHRDVMAVCACWPRSVLKANADDVFIGSPPLAFTFGLGGLVLFPMSIGASTVLLEKAGPAQLVEAIRDYGATVLFTAPTSYRAMAARGTELRSTALRKCVSAGEALPAATRALWQEATGIALIDGIGATEMLHIFISADEQDARPGATGKVVPGYEARIVDDLGQPLPPGTIGKLAVRGPTGCRYLRDARQTNYVKDGWNLTGDAYLMDAQGYFYYQSRTDDMIISSGYNIASPEVEEALMRHPAVAECAVIGVADDERGQIVKAYIVLRPDTSAGDQTVKALQDFVKQTIAPYKYPRAIEFVATLPRTQTGKLQRFKLRPDFQESNP